MKDPEALKKDMEKMELVSKKLKEKPKKKMSKEKLEKNKKNVNCIFRWLGIEAKKGVGCINIVSMFLIFLMGGIAGNGTVLQTVYLLGAAESKDDDAVTDVTDTTYAMGITEFWYILASCLSAPFFGYAYEMTSRRLVLGVVLICLGLVLLVQFFY